MLSVQDVFESLKGHGVELPGVSVLIAREALGCALPAAQVLPVGRAPGEGAERLQGGQPG